MCVLRARAKQRMSCGKAGIQIARNRIFCVKGSFDEQARYWRNVRRHTNRDKRNVECDFDGATLRYFYSYVAQETHVLRNSSNDPKRKRKQNIYRFVAGKIEDIESHNPTANHVSKTLRL